jgi:membrane fusion protein (multidrug efflux system)
MRYLLLASAFATVVLSGCHAKGSKDEKRDAVVELPVIKLTQKDTVLEQLYVTDIHAIQNVQVRAKVAGYIEDILVDEGKQVKKDQLLFIINDDEYEADLDKAKAAGLQAEAEAKTAEVELSRIKMLVGKKVIAPSEAELGEAKLRVAKAKIEEAKSAEKSCRIRLGYTKVRAPFDGIIDRIPLKRGSLVSEGVLLTSISDLSAMYAYFKFSENEYLHYLKLKKNHKDYATSVDLILADGTGYPQKGEVETMESEFDGNTGSIALRAKFPNPEQILKHGATGKLRLKTMVEDAVLVPQKAVLEIQDKNYVFLLGNDNIIRMKNFVPKARIDEFFIVLSGLKPGDAIVYEGVQTLKEGIQVSPRYLLMDSLIAMSEKTRTF